jgi:uncharacterized membrane protein
MTLAVDFESGFTDAFNSLITFLPKLLAFLVILIVGYFIAKAIGKIIDKVLERFGFDRAVERGGIKKAMEQSKYDPSDIVSKLVFYALFLLVLQAAFGVFGPNPVSDLLSDVVAFLPNIAVAIVIVVVAAAIAQAVNDLLSNALGGLSYGPILAKAAAGLIVFFGVVAALNQINVAEFVTQAITTAVLVAVVGTIIIGAGGGLIKPMQHRWENLLDKAEDEGRNAKNEVERSRGDTPYPGETGTPTSTPRSTTSGSTSETAGSTQSYGSGTRQ